jgi:hypothetical protein
MRSKAYQRISRMFVAQLNDRKRVILFINRKLRIPYFEPGGQGFESLRAHFLSKKLLGCPGHEIGASRSNP